MNYAKLAFTEGIKKLQEQNGSRRSYEKMEKYSSTDGLTYREIKIIEESDRFYMASYGTNEFPYIQHRGGPKGFLKVINSQTLGFLDFSGNRQYISTGNIQTHNKVALIMVDYPARTRLKIYAEAEVLNMDEHPQIREKLELSDYKHQPERIIVYHIKAYDWNCPQHITPRYTKEEIDKAFSAQKEYIGALEREVSQLKKQLKLV